MLHFPRRSAVHSALLQLSLSIDEKDACSIYLVGVAGVVDETEVEGDEKFTNVPVTLLSSKPRMSLTLF